jgi:hypothetical protein
LSCWSLAERPALEGLVFHGRGSVLSAAGTGACQNVRRCFEIVVCVIEAGGSATSKCESLDNPPGPERVLLTPERQKGGKRKERSRPRRQRQCPEGNGGLRNLIEPCWSQGVLLGPPDPSRRSARRDRRAAGESRRGLTPSYSRRDVWASAGRPRARAVASNPPRSRSRRARLRRPSDRRSRRTARRPPRPPRPPRLTTTIGGPSLTNR